MLTKEIIAVLMIAQHIYADVEVKSSSNLPSDDVCGTNTESRIVGGSEAELDEFPWMALLQYQYENATKFECGGALISDRYVLTAAHCVKSNLVSVRLGEYNITTETDCINSEYGEDCAPPAIDIDVEKKIIHENFSFNIQLRNDIGLLRLKQTVTFNDFIKPICLLKTTEDLNKTYVGERLFVAGWGTTENSTHSNIKLKVQVPVTEFRRCRITYRTEGINVKEDSQMCVGGEKGRDSCRGDSGGPLMASANKNRDVRWYVVGLVSMGPGNCGKEKWPGIYTRISKYSEWIINKLEP